MTKNANRTGQPAMLKKTRWWHSGLLLIWLCMSITTKTLAIEQELRQLVNITFSHQANASAEGNGRHVYLESWPEKINLQCNSRLTSFKISSRKWRINSQTTPEDPILLPKEFDESGTSLVECYANSKNRGTAYAFTYVHRNGDPVDLVVDEEPSVNITIIPSEPFEGGEVSVVCEAHGKDVKPTLLRNGQVLEVPAAAASPGNSVTFKIPYAWKNDSGVYGCKASTKDEKPIAYSDLLLEIRYKPILHLVPEDTLVVDATESSVLWCSSEAFPVSAIRWIKDGEDIQCEEDESCEYANYTTTTKTFSELTLSNVTVDSNYSCQSSNDVGTVVKSTIVKVNFKRPEIDGIQEQKFVLYDGQTNLDCNASGWPTPSVRWIKDEKVVSKSSTLQLQRFSQDNEGIYFCVAKNVYGSDTISVQLRGIHAVKPTSEGGKLVKSAGSSAFLDCSSTADGSLPIERTWFKDAKEHVAHSGKVNVTISYLTVQDHEGRYRCAITTSLGEKINVNWDLEVHYAPPKLGRSKLHLQVLQGQDITVPCEVSEGTPAPKIRWSLNSITLAASLTSNLIITDVDARNQGKYSCMAVNEYGRDVMIAEVQVLNRTRVSISPESNYEANTLGTVIMKCHVAADPRITDSMINTSWFKNAEELPVNSNQLTIKNVTLEDSGTFTCKVATPFDNATASTRLTVKGAGPTFVSIDKDIRVWEGSNAKLRCRADGFPTPKVSWTRMGRKMSKRWTRYSQASRGDLMISEVENEDEGTFQCEAKNIYGSIRTEIAVVVIKRLSGSVFKEVKGSFSGNVTIDCDISVDSRIKEEIKTRWFKRQNGNSEYQLLLTKGKKYDLLTNGSLRILNLHGTDMGLYECQVESPYDETSHNLSLTVFGQFPSILSTPRKIVLLEGDSTTLECLYTGIPKPEARWYLNDFPLTTTPHHRKGYEERKQYKSSRKLKEVTRTENSGNYKCGVTNQYGTSSAQIAEVEVVKQTSVYISEEGIKINAGQQLKIPCHVNNDRLNKIISIEWEKDDHKLDVTSRDRVDFGMDGSITIVDAQMRHKGIYRCVVSTAFDVVNATVEVEVVVNAPVILSHSKDQVVFSGESVVLLCHADGIPPPEIEWIVNNTKTEVKGKEYRVTNAMSIDVGNYTCIANNPYGGTKREISFDVVQLPILKAEYLLQPGQNLTLPCVDKSRHKGIAVVWMKSGSVIESAKALDILQDGALQLKNFTYNDVGKYSCTVLSSSSERRKVLTTNVGLKQKLIVNSGGTLHALASESLTLECNVLTQVKAKRLWKYNGSFFLHDSRKTVMENGKFLKIVDLRKSDSGNYSCVSSAKVSKGGRDTITLAVTVLEPEMTKVKKGCNSSTERHRVSVRRVDGVDNRTASVKWQLPSDFNKSCYDAVNVAWWSNETTHYFEEHLKLDETEVLLRPLNGSAGYYVQVNLVVAGTTVLEGYTASFAVPNLFSERKLQTEGAEVRKSDILHRYGPTIISVVVTLCLVVFAIIVVVTCRTGACRICRHLLETKEDSKFGKTDFNGFASNAYHSSISIPLEADGNAGSTSGAEYKLRVSTALQWPEPDNNTNCTYDERDPFIQRRSFSPNSSSSACVLSPQHRTKRNSKASISSSWSSLFNVPVVTEFRDLPTAASSSMQHNKSHLPTEPTFTPKKRQQHE